MSLTSIKLRTILILTFSLITLATTTVLTLLSTNEFRKRAIEHLAHHGRDEAAYISLITLDSLISEDFASLQHTVKSFQAAAHYGQSLTITDPDGIVIASSNADTLGETYKHDLSYYDMDHPFIGEVRSTMQISHFHETDKEGKTVLFHAPIKASGTIVGWVYISYDKQEIADEITAIKKKILLMGLVIWGASIFLAFLLTRLVTFPMAKMMTIAAQIAAGDFNRQDIQTNITELQLFNNVLNRMTEEIKKREESLRRSETKMRTILDSSPDLIFLADTERKILWANKAVLRIHPDAVGKYCYEALAGNTKTCADCPSKRTFASKEIESGIVHHPGMKLVGESYWENITVPQFDDKGEFTGFIEVARNITARRLAEEEKKKLEKKLNQAHKMESIGLMAGGVAHDLNNILSGIVGYPDLLLMKLPEDSPLRDSIQAIKDSGKRAAEVVADLLTVARGVASTKTVVNLNRLVNEYLESPECLNLKLSFQDISCETELAPDLLNIHCSEIHIKKCIMNLVINAAEALKTEGTISISTQNLYIEETQAKNLNIGPGEYVTLTISDTGPGISRRDIDHIFEPFYSKKKIGRSGTGLGLTLVWNTIQDHKGAITVKSDGSGTTFSLFFPATQDELKAGEDAIEESEIQGIGETVLIVDDEPLQHDIAGQILTDLGYRVEVAASGEEAVEYLKDHTVDLIILDMIMGSGMNGRQTYEEIIKLHPGQKAIIASGFSESEDVKKTLKLGAGRFISKPYTIKSFSKAVAEELKKIGTKTQRQK